MEFDEFVDTFTNEHTLFTNALKGIFLEAVVSGEITPAKLSAIEAEAYRAGKAYYDSAISKLDAYGQEMMLDGSDELTASVTARKQYAIDSIRLSIVSSIKKTTSSARSLALGGSVPVNVLASVIDKVKSPDGRTWQATKLAKVIVRDFAYQSMTDRDVDSIIKSGAEMVTISYKTPGVREYENAKLTIDEFASLRKKIFHINASARVSANV